MSRKLLIKFWGKSNEPTNPIIEQSKIDAGVKIAIAQAIEKHRKLGQSISIWRDGKVVTLTAEQIASIQIKNIDARVAKVLLHLSTTQLPASLQ